MDKRALITGITGQDGSYLADHLLELGYTVFGLERRSSSKNRGNVAHIEDDINWLSGDLTDQNSLARAISQSEPHEVYNLASQSFVKESWNSPEYTGDVTGLGVLRMLEAIRESYWHEALEGGIKFYQASSSEMFGKQTVTKANEDTMFYPRSPYGIAKLYAHWITTNYRESYNMFACSGILFNHESPRRGIEFVTRKITDGVAKIMLGKEDHITLGNLDAKRDWGYALDYVKAMHLMLQQDEPQDFVIATGEAYSIREFLDAAFNCIHISDWGKYVKQDPRFMRPAEVNYLCGDSSKAKDILGWEPDTSFERLVYNMVREDIERLSK